MTGDTISVMEVTCKRRFQPFKFVRKLSVRAGKKKHLESEESSEITSISEDYQPPSPDLLNQNLVPCRNNEPILPPTVPDAVYSCPLWDDVSLRAIGAPSLDATELKPPVEVLLPVEYLQTRAIPPNDYGDVEVEIVEDNVQPELEPAPSIASVSEQRIHLPPGIQRAISGINEAQEAPPEKWWTTLAKDLPLVAENKHDLAVKRSPMSQGTENAILSLPTWKDIPTLSSLIYLPPCIREPPVVDKILRSIASF